MKKIITASAAICGTVLLCGCASTRETAAESSAGFDPYSFSFSLPPAQSRPLPAPQENSSDSEGTIAHIRPADFSRVYDKFVLVGDSRTYQYGANVLGLEPTEERLLFAETAEGDVIIGAGGEGCDWLYEHTEEIEAQLADNCALVVNMGVNGAPEYHTEIADWCNNEAEKYADRGVKVFFMSVNPINTAISDGYGYVINNDDVLEFNRAIRTELKNVAYIDTYSFIEEDILGHDSATGDGLHYDDYVYGKIMDFTFKEILWQQDDKE